MDIRASWLPWTFEVCYKPRSIAQPELYGRIRLARGRVCEEPRGDARGDHGFGLAMFAAATLVIVVSWWIRK